MANKTRKTEERRKGIDDINAVIQQIYRDQDLTQGEGAGGHLPGAAASAEKGENRGRRDLLAVLKGPTEAPSAAPGYAPAADEAGAATAGLL